MVSLGDTAISLHILQPSKPKMPRIVQISIWEGGGGVLESQNPKCQDLSKFQFGGRGVLNQVPEQGCSVQFGQKFLEA